MWEDPQVARRAVVNGKGIRVGMLVLLLPMPSNVWLRSDRYSATASALNSADYPFIAISYLFLWDPHVPVFNDVLPRG